MLSAFSRSAVAGLTSTALSQVSLVIGFGSSCSQPLLANRPSRTAGSLRKAISRPRRRAAGVRRRSARRADARHARDRTAVARSARVGDDAVVQPAAPVVSNARGAVAGVVPSELGRTDCRSRTRGRCRSRIARAGRSSRRAARAPTCRRRAARSAAGRSTRCRRNARASLHASRKCASGNLPMAQRRRLIVVEAEVNAELRPCSSRRRT